MAGMGEQSVDKSMQKKKEKEKRTSLKIYRRMFNENNQAIFYNIISRRLIKRNYEPIPFTNARPSSAPTVYIYVVYIHLIILFVAIALFHTN